MRTLASELGDVAARLWAAPRIYADANLPAGLVRLMREQLRWDVLFVVEEDDLRRAADARHYRLAAQLHRTLVTLDRDYLDDIRFPPGEGGGTVVLSAPDEQQLARLLTRLDRVLFQDGAAMPLSGRKLQVHADWTGVIETG